MYKTFIIGLLSTAILVLTACADKDDPLYYDVTLDSVSNITAGSALVKGHMTTNDKSARKSLIITGETLLNNEPELILVFFDINLHLFGFGVDFLKANTDYTFTLAYIKDEEKHKGNSYSFTTPAETTVPFSELMAFNIDVTSVILLCDILGTGGANIHSHGFWLATEAGLDESEGTYYEHEWMVENIFAGHFNSRIENLTSNTTYYARPYAIKDMGISFGEEISFTTLSY